jgi:hypothetical protein
MHTPCLALAVRRLALPTFIALVIGIGCSIARAPGGSVRRAVPCVVSWPHSRPMPRHTGVAEDKPCQAFSVGPVAVLW